MAEPDSLDQFLAARRKREIDSHSKLGMHVVVACEPRYYREVVGESIRGLRPAVEVVIVDPEELADGVSHLDPDLVISVHPASIDPGGRSAWVQFVPYEKPAATVSIGGRRQELEELMLEDLLWVVDQADELSRTRKDLRNH
jgi:F420-dependent methylenetetrahydromethanopterin dehydrogenase